MKYCTKCGNELHDEAAICPKCGCYTETRLTASDSATLKLITKIFMIIGCIITGIYLIPLCWTIPMTLHYCKATQEHRPLGTGFKVCSLIFVNLIAGILMLCDDTP